MNIKLNGNVVSIISTIKFEALKKCTKKEPLFIKDKDGKKIYGVETSTIGNITKAGVAFSYGTAEDFAALNICIPPELSADKAKEYVLDNLSAELNLLKEFEDIVNGALTELDARRTELADSITVS